MRIGIDLGGTNIAAAVVDGAYRIVEKDSVKTGKDRPYQEIIRDMAELALQLVQRAGCTPEQIEAIGIGSPGVLDRNTGYVLYSNNIPWENVNLCGEFRRYFDRPLYIDNDASCAALGEHIAGAARGYDSALCITLGTGIGGGLILNGKIYSGFNSAAGSMGHTTLISGGEQCTCGRRGCWEAYGSVTGLIRMANEQANRMPQGLLAKKRAEDTELTGKNIFEAARAGDEGAQDLVNRYLFYVAEGITNFINALQPEVITIGGGISREGDFILEPILRYIKRDVFCKNVKLPELKIATLGNDAGIIGAAFLKENQSRATCGAEHSV